jgi:hypothetical protein
LRVPLFWSTIFSSRATLRSCEATNYAAIYYSAGKSAACADVVARRARRVAAMRVIPSL